MNFTKAIQKLRDDNPKRITTLDSHTAGESTRLVISGYEPVAGDTMREKRENFMREQDHLRLMLTREPRGHRDMLSAVVTEPCTPGADFGLIYMDAKRYPYLCGHATIGAVTSLIETGCIPAEDPISVIVDTPSGPMRTTARIRDGKAVSVSYTSVPAYVQEGGRHLEVSGYGILRVDIVYSGGFFAMVDSAQTRLELTAANANVLIPLGMHVIEAANRQFHITHPERTEVSTIDVAEFHNEIGPGRGRGFVVYGEGHMDRSPCGTGTAARLALLHERGVLSQNEPYVSMSPLGTEFEARIAETTQVGGYTAVIAEISGSAYLTGIHEFILDESDPFPEGYLP